MSHFTVLVVGDNPEEQLAPFQENNNGDCPQEYMEFEDKTEEYEEEWKSGKCREFHCSSSCSWGQSVSKENFSLIKKAKVGDKVTLTIDEGRGIGGLGYFRVNQYYRCYAVSEKHEAPTEHIWVKVNKILQTNHPDNNVCFDGDIEVTIVKEPKEITFKERYGTYEKFLKDWHGVSEKDEKTGRYGYWYNPNAKWDWFQIGGRWSGKFLLKPGATGFQGERSLLDRSEEEMPANRVDQAKKGDIDWETMERESKIEAEKNWDEAHKKDGDNSMLLWGCKKGITKAEYIASYGRFSTFAVLKDGKWYEKGEMGWWAMVSNEKEESAWDTEFQKLINNLNDEVLLSVVDCHI